jgi:pSer/pThr/pTyr-binding forkhead associated (FHA) protein
MKITLRDVQTSFESWLVRLRQVLDPPLTADAQPLEIREGIVDAIEQRAVPSGGGQRVLAHNQISVTVLAPTHDDRLALQAVLGDLQNAVVSRLREIRCQIPAGFAVVVHYTRRARPGWAPEQRLVVEYSSRDAAMTPGMSRLEPPNLRVTILRGRATQVKYTLTESHVRIGRTALPVDSGGRPRKNHIAFVEDGDEDSNSVGRAHASIRFEPARGEYRVFDDGSRNGTRVVRSGTTLEILRRDPTGVTLLSGDEIQLGTAAIRVEIERRA